MNRNLQSPLKVISKQKHPPKEKKRYGSIWDMDISIPFLRNGYFYTISTQSTSVTPSIELTPDLKMDFTAALISGMADSKISSMPSQFMLATSAQETNPAKIEGEDSSRIFEKLNTVDKKNRPKIMPEWPNIIICPC